MTTLKENWDVIIIGAGAAGLMAAAVAASRGRQVLLLERNAKVGRKILISGGGRCNFTNTSVSHEHYYSTNQHFMKSALSRYAPNDFIDLVKHYNIAFHEKKLGQLFCNKSAIQIVNLLVSECAKFGATIACEATIKAVSGRGPFTLDTTLGNLSCDSLIIATGGLSIPKIGATDFGHQIARQFGLKLTDLRPALVPLTFSQADFPGFTTLAGTSVDSIVTYKKTSFRENILFTHWGLSGPAILQISLYWDSGQPIRINLMPDKEATTWLLELKESSPKITVFAALRRELPDRFAQVYADYYCNTGATPLAEVSSKQLRQLGQKLNQWEVQPTGTQGYKKAEVTRGGVLPKELSSKSLESTRVPGLFFIGEVVDVTGWLGGYNFQWAWASGYAAGQVA
jgi:predicted Rossmann fold flavoprotein